MASTYSTSLKIELPANGDQSGTWGTTVNNNCGTLLEQAIAGVRSITMANANYTLSNLNGLSDEARNAVLVVGGTNSEIRSVIAPAVSKQYIIKNDTSGGFAIIIKTSASTGVSIANGATLTVYCDGFEFYAASFPNTGGTIAGNLAVSGTLNVTGATTLVGTTTVPTPTAGDDSTNAASTAFVKTAITAVASTLGTMSTQNANAVAITGGTASGMTSVASTTFTGALVGNADSATVSASTTGNAATVTNGVYTTQFQSSLATAGYQKLPSGLIMQWGTTASINGDSSLAITFPTAYTTACLTVQVTGKGGYVTGTQAYSFGTGATTTTGFTIYNDGQAMISTWFSVGY